MGQLGPDRRVRRRTDFRMAQRRGKKLVSPHFVLLVFARDDDPAGPARLGLVVSKRVGNAVRRNRTKRLIREAFRHCPELWYAGIDLVVIARASSDELTSAGVLEEFRGLKQPLARQIARARKDREIRKSRLAASS